MIDYSKMSDTEVNQEVAKILHPESVVIESKSRPPSACITGHLPSLWVDYCNNPSDAWPIIVANRINIYHMQFENCWECFNYISGGHDCTHSNPLRAAMIVFLMMQDNQQ